MTIERLFKNMVLLKDEGLRNKTGESVMPREDFKQLILSEGINLARDGKYYYEHGNYSHVLGIQVTGKRESRL